MITSGTIAALVAIHLAHAAVAAASKGLHRSELPQLAAGAGRARWGDSRCLRPQDGVLPQWLAALPLELGWLAKRHASTWPPEERWITAETIVSVGCDGPGTELWRMGRILLWGEMGAPSIGAIGREADRDEDDDDDDEPVAVAEDDRTSRSVTIINEAIDGDSIADAMQWWTDGDMVQGWLWLARGLRLAVIAAPQQLLCAFASWHLWGAGGAVLTSFFAVFCPTLLTHHALLTADAPACLFLHTSLWSFWWVLHSSHPLSVCSASVSLGLLLSCGPTSLAFPPAAVLLLGCRLFSTTPTTLSLPMHWCWARHRMCGATGTAPGAASTAHVTVHTTMLLRWRAGRLLWQMLLVPLVLLLGAIFASHFCTIWCQAPVDLFSPRQTPAAASHVASVTSTRCAITVTGIDQSEACLPTLALRWIAFTILHPMSRVAYTRHKDAFLGMISGGGAGDWGEPPQSTDGNNGIPDMAMLIYRSGRFAARDERVGDGHPADSFHAMSVLLKTTPATAYLTLILALSALCVPLFAIVSFTLRLSGLRPVLSALRRRLAIILPSTLKASGILCPSVQAAYGRIVRVLPMWLAPARPRNRGVQTVSMEEAAEPSSLRQWAAAAAAVCYRAAPCFGALLSAALCLAAPYPPVEVGHRLMLPVYPAIYVLLGALVPLASDASIHVVLQPLLLLLVFALALAHVAESVSAHPHYLGYFAPIAGGVDGGHFHLLRDSLDQGQDLPTLHRWLQGHAEGHERVYLSYCGEDSPVARRMQVERLPASAENCPFWTQGVPQPSLVTAAIVATARPPPRRVAAADAAPHVPLILDLLPGLYCIDAGMLQALASRLKGPWTDLTENAHRALLQQGRLSQPAAAPLRFGRLCAMLRRSRPLANLGGSILVWRLTAADLRRAELDSPAELVRWSRLSGAMRRHQKAVVDRIMTTALGSPALSIPALASVALPEDKHAHGRTRSKATRLSTRPRNEQTRKQSESSP